MQFLKSILEKKHRFCCRSNASLNPTCSSICSYYVTVFCFFCLLLFLFYVLCFLCYWLLLLSFFLFFRNIKKYVTKTYVSFHLINWWIHFFNSSDQSNSLFSNWNFYQIFCFPTANFRPLSRGYPYSPDVNYCILSISTRRSSRNEVGSLVPVECLVGFEAESFQLDYYVLLTP